MNFTVQQTTPEAGEFPTYVLYDEAESQLLMANISQSQPPETRRQIRLTRPSGRLVATIDVPTVEAAPGDEGKEKRLDYAIIHEYAVYAIISLRHRPPSEGDGKAGVYYLLEVEGETWLALPDPEDSACYIFYDEVPSGLHTYDMLTKVDLPSSIGSICRDEEMDVLVSLEPRRLLHTDLVVLALALLIEQHHEGM